ncbi:MAG: hypothetical protein AB1410_08755 [Acidobacteriota bacterium]
MKNIHRQSRRPSRDAGNSSGTLEERPQRKSRRAPLHHSTMNLEDIFSIHSDRTVSKDVEVSLRGDD